MRKVAIFVLSLVGFGFAAGAPALALTYEGSPAPGGDCGEIAAARGAAATWYGEFAGNHYDSFREMIFPVSSRGCFESEYACRRWVNEAISSTGQGGMLYGRCTLGAPGY